MEPWSLTEKKGITLTLIAKLDMKLRWQSLKNGSNQSAKEKKIERLFSNLAKILGSIYEKSFFDFGDNKFREDLNNLFQQAMEIREVRGSEQFIFFNRITFGLISILMKLEAKVETSTAREIILNADC